MDVPSALYLFIFHSDYLNLLELINYPRQFKHFNKYQTPILLDLSIYYLFLSSAYLYRLLAPSFFNLTQDEIINLCKDYKIFSTHFFLLINFFSLNIKKSYTSILSKILIFHNKLSTLTIPFTLLFYKFSKIAPKLYSYFSFNNLICSLL